MGDGRREQRRRKEKERRRQRKRAAGDEQLTFGFLRERARRRVQPSTEKERMEVVA
jgi:hypothetical protein